MRTIGSNTYLDFSELMAFGIAEGTIKAGLSRNRAGAVQTWTSTPDPFDKRRVLIAYDSIPAATRAKLPAKADLLKALKAEQTELKALELACAGSALAALQARTVQPTDYNYYATQAGLTATPEGTVAAKAAQLVQAAGWLRLLAGLDTRAQLAALGFGRKEELRAAVLTEVLPLRLYGLRVANVRVLQNKELAFAQALAVTAEDAPAGGTVHELKQRAAQRALATLVPKRAGLQNAQKIGKQQGENEAIIPLGERIDGAEWHARTLLYLFTNPGKGGKFDLKEVYRRYERQCLAADQEPVSLSGMKAFLKRPDVRLHTAWERDGHAALDGYLPQQRRERPTYSLSKGGYDGFSVDFYTQVGEGKARAKVMLTVVAVFDFHSEAITGYAVGLVENGLLVRNMYRNHLQQVGGKSYLEMESDRFSGNLAQDTATLFERACGIITRPVPNDPRGRAANPKARLAERLLAEVNRLTQGIVGWKGTNITSIDAQRKPNPDYANAPVAAGTLEMGISQVNKLIAAYNHTPVEKWGGQTRWERLLADLHPDAPVLDALAQATLLHQHTVATVRHAALEITVNKRAYAYDFPAYVRHTHQMGKGLKVRVYYDETDMREVTVFGFTDAKDPGTDVYLATLRQGERLQMAKAEQTPADLALLGRTEAARRTLRDGLERKTLEVQAAALGLGLPGSLGVKELRELVLGAALTSPLIEDFDTRHAAALARPAAVAQVAYYDDALLRDEGMRVPVAAAPAPEAPKDADAYRKRLAAYRKQGYDFS